MKYDVVLKLRELRERSGMLQRDVAKKLGVSDKLISKIERGDMKTLDVFQLERILAVYGVSLEAFFGGHVDHLVEHETNRISASSTARSSMRSRGSSSS